jgi:hypothetical protein
MAEPPSRSPAAISRSSLAWFKPLNPDSAVAAEAMSEAQTFRSEVTPFGIANGKLWQISNSKIWNLQSAI